MRKKLFVFYLLITIFGFCLHEMVTIMSLVLAFLMLYPEGQPFDWITIVVILMYCFLVYVIASIAFKRVSNVLIYNRLNKKLSMNIRCFWRYWKLDYLNERKEIEKLLLKEFQEGMKNLVYRVRPRKFIVETHGWVYKKIKESQELQSLYSIKELPVKKPKNVIATEILCLMAWPYIFRNFKAIKEISMRERSVYKLEFIRRGK